MNTRITILLSTFCFLSAFQVQESTPESGIITFLQVDLVCGAASDIGCGSRSKPILNDLENHSAIAEAWLNRPGTIIAVVWNENQDADENLLRQTLKEHNKPGKVMGEKGSLAQQQSFRSERWYRTNEVDELSIEEAGRIAENIMDALVGQGLIGVEEASKMESEVETFIRTELLSLEDVNLLDQRAYYKGWETGIKEIAKSYMPQEKVDQIRLFVMSPLIKYSIYGGIVLFFIIILGLIYRWRRKHQKLSMSRQRMDERSD